LESAGAINIVKNNKNLPEQLAHELSSLNNDLKYYKEMSNKAASVSDGEGVKRVIKAMEV
jgi:UDP-N-acetylglucosamine:LPS N-acetylglucosamine transferase